ncbi:hypothetical protein MMC07_003590 [Pseudocyphellaria aurata]|nr:hypothetical protein [Pseudocyphellaria aurata]
MDTPTFSSLPAEIHISIAKLCEQNDLFSLCLTSRLMNERCFQALYTRVDLERDRRGLDSVSNKEFYRLSDAFKRQRYLVRTLLMHPTYGQHVRFFKGTLLCERGVGEGRRSEEMWSAMKLLTHVQSVEIGTANGYNYRLTDPSRQIPHKLFQSATSITLMGYLEYNLAKSILDAVDPATLKYLCLNMVQDRSIELFRRDHRPGNRGEGGRMIAYGVMSGLLNSLTGRCTALRTLVLQRRGQIQRGFEWHAAAEDASYMEWAAFISSVQPTLAHLTFEQTGRWRRGEPFSNPASSSRIMDDKFRRLILPIIVSRSWPCLTMIKVQGVRSQDGIGLATELRAVLGGDAEIVVKDRPVYVQDAWKIVEQYQS